MNTLDLQLALLRGESRNPIDVTAFARTDRLRLQVQKKGALSDRLSVNLLSLIAGGVLGPGARVPPERRIASAVTASRVCVRSALESLKTFGYLEAVQGSGTRVIRGSERLDELLAAHREIIADLGGFCDFLDTMLLERAVRAGDEARAAILRHIARRPGAPSPAAWEFALRSLLAELSGSEVLCRVTGHLKRGLLAYFGALTMSPPDTARRASLALVEAALADAVRRGDAPGAVGAMAERTALLRDAFDEANGGGIAVGEVAEDDLLGILGADPPETLGEIIAREIGGLLATGQLRRDDGAFSERRLADLFGVSRVTVQEALTRLKAHPGERDGPEPTGEEVRRMSDIAAARISSFQELCLLRHHLEVWAARRAAVEASADDQRDIRRIYNEMRRPIASPSRSIDLDLKLHLTIARAAGSALHLYICEVLRTLIIGYFEYSLTHDLIGPDREALLMDQHTAIVGAIAARDSPAAAGAMERHVRTFRDSYARANA